ncbi:MAG: nicotinate-nucleotide--dimethylbenzimidazole phosphoribosyltransferase [Arenicellales bacterium]
MHWYLKSAQPINQESVDRALARQQTLTKPPGSLGQLEQVAIRLCGMLGDAPMPNQPAIAVFAADHGVAEENVSAFPQVVTGEMVRNFASGGAAICVLARALQASLEVVHLGTVNDPGEFENVERAVIAASTKNMVKGPAMTSVQLDESMMAGREAVDRAVAAGCNIFIGGDMGIANTTAAAALVCAALKLRPKEVAGPGTGLNSAGVQHKASVIDRALTLHCDHLHDPLEILRRLGGFEIAALVGAYVAASQQGVPAVVDGFIAASAALLAARINPGCAAWLLLSHVSAEPGFQRLQQEIELLTQSAPMLDLSMRLGEGSGAAVTLPLIQNACRLHNEMATFEQSGVSFL